MFFLSTTGCSQVIRNWVAGGSNSPPNTTAPSIDAPNDKIFMWDFNDAADYSFNTGYIELSNGKLGLREVDQSHAGADFNKGSHNGTYVNDSGHISLLHKPQPEDIHVNTILPSLSPNLISYWRMDGNYNDSSSNNNDGTPVGSVNLTGTSKFQGNAAVFDGSAGAIEFANPISAPSSFSVSFWINPATCTDYNQSLGTDIGWDGFEFHTDTNCSIYTGITTATRINPADVGNQIVKLNSWQKFTFTYDSPSSKGTLYNNGQFLFQKTMPAPMPWGGFEIGLQNTSTMNGRVDEVAIWDLSLSADQVLILYNAQNSNLQELSASWTSHVDNIIGYWKMDGNWQDSSGQGHHGQAFGDATFDSMSAVGNFTGSFDGTGDYIKVNSMATELTSGTSTTFTTWFKTTATPGTLNGHIMFSAHDSGGSNVFRLGTATTGQIFIAIGPTGDQVLADGYNDGTWQFMAVTIDESAGGVKVYVNEDSPLDGTHSQINWSSATQYSIAQEYDTATPSDFFDGQIDELAVWNIALNAVEIRNIYHRQKQKYAGHYDSPILDVGISVPWANMAPKTAIPFYKQLPGSSEASSHYPSITGNLTDQLAGYWPLDEDVPNTAALGADFADISGNSRTADIQNGGTLGRPSIINLSPVLDGIDDFIRTGTFDLGPLAEITIAGWVKNRANSVSAKQGIFHKAGSVFQVFLLNDRLYSHIQNDSPWHQAANSNVFLDWDWWHHIVITYDGSNVKIFRDGLVVGVSGPESGLIPASNSQFHIGYSDAGGSTKFNGQMDEVALWTRALTATEIEHLYRRGGNRIKYQVKSCIDASCSCHSYNSSPIGTAMDCDGDALLNSVDPLDIFKSSWLGRNGATGESFSELQNCLSIDNISTGKCTGTINATSPDFRFMDYPATAQPANNRYFQYRVTMEAEENQTCQAGTTPCLPELEQLTVGPTGRYFAGTHIITTLSSTPFKSIEAIEFTAAGCPITYQLSTDGTTYYHWNGSLWALASGPNLNESSSATEISENITAVSEQIGIGNLFLKIFMTSNVTQSCELSKITVTRTK